MARTPRLTRALVNKLPQKLDERGPVRIPEPADCYYAETAAAVLSALGPDEPLWVFAIGSLIWNPRFEDVERQNAVVKGWRRSFCLGPDTRYRGSPRFPGRMLTMVKSDTAQCPGIAIRMQCADRLAGLEALLRKEPPYPPTWVTAETNAGPLPAIAFTLDRNMPGFLPDAPDEEVADILATAVGHIGSMADYLLNTVTELEAAGVFDPYIWRLQDMVAARLERR